MPREQTEALLDRTLIPGEHVLEFFSPWATEVEKGTMSRAAARFWSHSDRQHLLRPCLSMEDILEDWDEEAQGGAIRVWDSLCHSLCARCRRCARRT